MIMNCLMAANRKELACRVITVKPFEDKLRNELDSALKQCSKESYIYHSVCPEFLFKTIYEVVWSRWITKSDRIL
jgi:hypothetical protein